MLLIPIKCSMISEFFIQCLQEIMISKLFAEKIRVSLNQQWTLKELGIENGSLLIMLPQFLSKKQNFIGVCIFYLFTSCKIRI